MIELKTMEKNKIEYFTMKETKFITFIERANNKNIMIRQMQ